MFRFFLGATEQEVRSTNKALTKKLIQAEKTIETLREEAENKSYEATRFHREQLRNVVNECDDRLARYVREDVEKMQAAEDEHRDQIRKIMDEHRALLAKKDEEIATLKSELREANLALAEETQDIDLAIREGIIEAKEGLTREVLEQINRFEIENAKLQGELKASKAETASKDAIIAVLTKQAGTFHDDVETMIEFAEGVTPKVNLDKFNINVEVPAPVMVTQKGDSKEQQKKN